MPGPLPAFPPVLGGPNPNIRHLIAAFSSSVTAFLQTKSLAVLELCLSACWSVALMYIIKGKVQTMGSTVQPALFLWTAPLWSALLGIWLRLRNAPFYLCRYVSRKCVWFLVVLIHSKAWVSLSFARGLSVGDLLLNTVLLACMGLASKCG